MPNLMCHSKPTSWLKCHFCIEDNLWGILLQFTQSVNPNLIFLIRNFNMFFSNYCIQINGN